MLPQRLTITVDDDAVAQRFRVLLDKAIEKTGKTEKEVFVTAYRWHAEKQGDAGALLEEAALAGEDAYGIYESEGLSDSTVDEYFALELGIELPKP